MSHNGNRWSAILVVMICMIKNWSARKQGSDSDWTGGEVLWNIEVLLFILLLRCRAEEDKIKFKIYDFLPHKAVKQCS